MAKHELLKIADGFWNIRGSFKVGLLDIGTHASLVRLQSGGFVLLDSYPLTGEVDQEVRALTDDGKMIEAIVNLHPFHTVFVKKTHAEFPNAKLYGTARHHSRLADLPWEPECTESEAFHALFEEDFDFMVPRGVDFISANENIHFSSVIALHPQSNALHVDDTLMFTKIPFLGGVRFHVTLKAALERKAGAAKAFREWAEELAVACEDVEHLCAAHTQMVTRQSGDASFGARIRAALAKEEKTLTAHEAKHG